MISRTNTTTILSKLACATLALAASSCVSLDQLAPPVAAVSSRPSATLSQGRDLYITRCAKCHAPEPVRKYSESRWNEILPEMVEETKLTPTEAGAVREYVMAVLHSGPVPVTARTDG